MCFAVNHRLHVGLEFTHWPVFVSGGKIWPNMYMWNAPLLSADGLSVLWLAEAPSHLLDLSTLAESVYSSSLSSEPTAGTHRSLPAQVKWLSGRVRQAWFCTKVSKHCRLKHPVFSCFLAFVCLLLMHSSHHAQSIYLFTFQWTLDRHQAKRFGYVSYCRRIYVIQTSDAIIGELKSSRIGIKFWHFCVLNIGGICVVFKVCIKSKLASWLIVFV